MGILDEAINLFFEKTKKNLADEFGYIEYEPFINECNKLTISSDILQKELLNIYRNNMDVLKKLKHDNDNLYSFGRKFASDNELYVNYSNVVNRFPNIVRDIKNDLSKKIACCSSSEDLEDFIDNNIDSLDLNTLRLAILLMKNDLTVYYGLKKSVDNSEEKELIEESIEIIRNNIDSLLYLISDMEGKNVITAKDEVKYKIFLFESDAGNPIIFKDLKEMDVSYMPSVRKLIDSIIYNKPKYIKKFKNNESLLYTYEVRDIIGKVRLTFSYIASNCVILFTTFIKNNNAKNTYAIDTLAEVNKKYVAIMDELKKYVTDCNSDFYIRNEDNVKKLDLLLSPESRKRG